ncbi:hypothetical protein GCM10017771_76000 [Streptomyces capitiformicae]|uniref:Uncharacterized protein n=1 Tax=Streptomyces capitiformicae TaxID=2014920 RepID=A0A918ZIP9_9ACTN|nr:hypothetical protein GCM10017771_76000 [Streptomyces capitiformicae]
MSVQGSTCNGSTGPGAVGRAGASPRVRLYAPGAHKGAIAVPARSFRVCALGRGSL